MDDKRSYLGIFGSSWGKPPDNSFPMLLVDNQCSRWSIRNEGIYSFLENEDGVFLTQMKSDGSRILWNVGLCATITDSLVSSIYKTAFIYCSSQNIIYKLNDDNGLLLDSFDVEQKVVSIECSTSFLLVLYSDGKVMQYSHDFIVLYTYNVQKDFTKV
jgi:outer membrane protein assembly factor BamB